MLFEQALNLLDKGFWLKRSGALRIWKAAVESGDNAFVELLQQSATFRAKLCRRQLAVLRSLASQGDAVAAAILRGLVGFAPVIRSSQSAAADVDRRVAPSATVGNHSDTDDMLSDAELCCCETCTFAKHPDNLSTLYCPNDSSDHEYGSGSERSLSPT
jgi:hypothetical protein